MHISGEFQSLQGLHEVWIEDLQALQIADILGTEPVGFQFLEDGFQSGGHEEVAFLVGITDKNGKRGAILNIMGPIPGGHGYFIEVG